MSKILIEHADYVVTVDPERRIIRDGAVAIVGDRIAGVGKTDRIKAEHADAEVIDGRGKMVLPGLFDTHIHGAQQLGRGLGDNMYQRFFTHLWKIESEMDDGDALCAFRLCQLELIRAGVTCFADPGNYFPAIEAQAMKESGLRGIIARTALDVNRPGTPEKFCETTAQALARSEQFVAEHHNTLNGRVKAWVSMRMAFGCSDELLRGMGALARKHGAGIIGHACSSREPTVMANMKYGMGDVARLEKLGVLGPNMLLLHMAWLGMDEVMLVKQRDVKVSIAPGSSFHQAMGNINRGKAPEMAGLGVTLSLGSDAAMSGNFLDVLRNAYLMVGGYLEARMDPKTFTPEDAVEMLTIDGARSTLWEDDLGSLEVGKKADITVLDIMRPEWQPVHNPISNLIYCAHGGCADTVIVDGRVLMRDKQVLTLNEDDLYDEARERAAVLVKRAGLESSALPRWPMA
jgi:5-methylthioadenosine/S-adenosylhomocysteine deaminase